MESRPADPLTEDVIEDENDVVEETIYRRFEPSGVVEVTVERRWTPIDIYRQEMENAQSAARS